MKAIRSLPPRGLGVRSFFRTVAVALLCLLLCSLCACGETSDADKNTHTSHVTRDFYETINGIEWRVSYYSETREIASIFATSTERDRTSEYYKFIAYYHGDSNMYALHDVVLMGTPVGDDWYQIEQVETYTMPYMDADDFERVKKTYPSCTFDANDRVIILSERTTRYEERLVFEEMPD